MEEEEVYHTPTIHSAFSYSPKVIGKHKDKDKSKTNSNSISEPSENNDPGKVKKVERRSSPAVCAMGILVLVQMSVESVRSGHIFHATYTIRERTGEGIIDARDVYIN